MLWKWFHYSFLFWCCKQLGLPKIFFGDSPNRQITKRHQMFWCVLVKNDQITKKSPNFWPKFGQIWFFDQKYLVKFWSNIWPKIHQIVLLKTIFMFLCFYSVEFYFVFFSEYFLGDLFWKIRKKSEIFWEFIFFFPPEKTQQIFSSSNKKSIYRIIHRKKNCKKDLEYSGI